MKVGSSLSRCVRDIYEGTIDIYDVLVIVARTDFDPEDDQQWNAIWQGYHHGGAWSHPEWADFGETAEQDIRDICIALKTSGKLHQPRQYGARPQRLSHHWYDVVLSDSVVQSNPAAKKAWENYKIIAGLS